MQERKAIREQRELDPDAWSLPVSEISARRVRHREADGYLASRPPMCLLGKLMSLWEEVDSVTGQRSNSNQLNYVPLPVFLLLLEPLVFTGFPHVQSFRLRRSFQPHRTKFRG
jgi:hypothetical protein